MCEVVKEPTVSDEDILAISENGLKTSKGGPSLSDTGAREVAVRLLRLFQYNCEEIYLVVDQTGDPPYVLCDIREKHSEDLAESIRTQRNSNGLVLLKILFSAELNRDASSVSKLFDENEGRKVVKYGFLDISLDTHHRRTAVQMLQEEGYHIWRDSHLLMSPIMRQDRLVILHAKAINLGKVNSTSTAFLTKETTDVRVMEALISFAGVVSM